MPGLTTPHRSRRNAELAWRWGFWGGVVAVLVLSLIPVPPELPGTGWDKSNHLIAFGLLAVFGLLAHPLRYGWLLAGLLLFGGLIEALQSLTTYRLAEWLDWLADAIGIVAGYGLVWLWQLIGCRCRPVRPAGDGGGR